MAWIEEILEETPIFFGEDVPRRQLPVLFARIWPRKQRYRVETKFRMVAARRVGNLRTKRGADETPTRLGQLRTGGGRRSERFGDGSATVRRGWTPLQRRKPLEAQHEALPPTSQRAQQASPFDPRKGAGASRAAVKRDARRATTGSPTPCSTSC